MYPICPLLSLRIPSTRVKARVPSLAQATIEGLERVEEVAVEAVEVVEVAKV